MKTRLRIPSALVPVVASVMIVTLPTAAWPQAATSPFQGFQQNRNDPINIESLSLEVRDKDKVATFIDNVKLTQGDLTLECRRLVVFYDEEPTAGPPAKGKQAKSVPAPGSRQQQQVRRLEARGGVVVTQKDQVATGDTGVYDMKTNSIVMTGNVVLTQGQNVVKGDKIYVDMTSGVSRVESGSAGQSGPVRALLNPGSMREAAQSNPAGQGAAAQPSPASVPRTGSAAATTGTAGPASGATGSGSDKKQNAPRPLRLN